MIIWNIATLEQREIADDEGFEPGWTSLAPPDVPAGKRALMGDGEWALVDLPPPASMFAPPPEPEPDPDSAPD